MSATGWTAKPFSADEQAKMIRLRKAGFPWPAIAVKLGRSLPSVACCAQRMKKAGLFDGARAFPDRTHAKASPEMRSLQSSGRVAAFCARISIPVSAIEDYRAYRRNSYTPAEAAAICRGAARP